ncbi:hypothetical protein B4U45_16745 [Mycobacterium persicum]|uniref:Uncharacterized protein n=1 Tax=Mycobacterium persicum TaxID=1487726 RepID=A0A8E2IT24_9MYCO|nr:hypothetical protein [Mycobacterium persicum]KZS84790.1 hypothetical protein A4G31_15605 [Mycobacterium persicum]ORB95986.1 hypothetical protein B1T44_17425 [Mycobacterium persicum]ORC08003.1 hypothetical protein B4U45_16745 [Mycobacterium persicum]VAZ71066.1 hypothetical protein LAUMK15_00639 [Mycobacterium persicum]VAZ87178.1 hypothetical protein LAUMK4_00286 [Mycobacterium persicum]
MDPRANTTVRAANRATAIIMKAFSTREDTVLFDPVRVPVLAERADAAAADFHLREGEASRERALGLPPSLQYKTLDTDSDPDATHEQGVAKIWRVGGSLVYVVRDRWRHEDNRDRSMSPAEEIASLLLLDRSVDDYWCFGGEHNPRYVRDYELRCTVNIAHDCTAPLSPDVNEYGGGTTRWLPVDRAPLIMLFRCCTACETLAGKFAANTYKTAVINARADLPPGAVILPNPEPDVNPDAWA